MNWLIRRFGKPRNSWAGGHTLEFGFKLWRLRVQFDAGTTDGLGRFGGGWNWALGFTASRNTLILNLLVCRVRIGWAKPFKLAPVERAVDPAHQNKTIADMLHSMACCDQHKD